MSTNVDPSGNRSIHLLTAFLKLCAGFEGSGSKLVGSDVFLIGQKAP